MKDLVSLLNEVVDEESFIIFIERLASDFSDNKSEWQNIYIHDYFDCASEWARESRDGLKYYKRSKNPWRRVADILSMGKIYE